MNAINPVNRQFLESLAHVSLADVLAMLQAGAPAESAPSPEAPVDPPEPTAAIAHSPDAIGDATRDLAHAIEVDDSAPKVDPAPPEVADNIVAFPIDAMPTPAEASPEVALAVPDMALEVAESNLAEASEESSGQPTVTMREHRMCCDRQALAKAIGAVIKTVDRRNTVPVLMHVLIRGAGDTITVEGTDLDMLVRATVSATVTQGFAITVSGHRLYDLLRKAGEGEVGFAFDETTTTQADGAASVETGPVRIKTGPTSTSLSTLPVADYPDLDPGEFRTTFTLPAPALVEAFRAIEFAISTEETRYYLNGVYLHPFTRLGQTILRLVSTDGHRLAAFDLRDTDAPRNMAGVIVPRKAVALARSLFDTKARKRDAAPPATVTVEISDTRVRLTCGPLVILSKLIDGTFPDYTRVIPQGNDKKLTCDASELAAAVGRVSTIATERGRAIKFSLDPGALTLSVNNPETGSMTERMDVDYSSNGMDIGFNAGYLGDILSRIDGPVVFELADPGSPTLIESANDGRALYVLMPMRV